MISFQFDERSILLVDHILVSHERLWDTYMNTEYPRELAKKAEEHFKPMLSVRPVHTGKLEQSITHEVNNTGDGWSIDWYGLFYGLYMDVGNFDPNMTLYAADYGLKFFPVDKRLGASMKAQKIHGMGAKTKDSPTHYSEKTVEWLANSEAGELGMHYMTEFLDGLVIE